MKNIQLFILLIANVLLSMPFVSPAYSAEFADVELMVKLAPDIDYADVTHMGRVIRIMRNQNLGNLLEEDYSRTSRPCPPFCIQPIEVSPGVQNQGELEIVNFLQQDVASGKGLLVDVRMPQFYDAETIPGAVNIPFLLLSADTDAVLPMLGAVRSGSGWSFHRAKTLLIFCNGPWCTQAASAIKLLIDERYPRARLRYYRGGMQMWKMLGLSTISPIVLGSNQ